MFIFNQVIDQGPLRDTRTAEELIVFEVGEHVLDELLDVLLEGVLVGRLVLLQLCLNPTDHKDHTYIHTINMQDQTVE